MRFRNQDRWFRGLEHLEVEPRVRVTVTVEGSPRALENGIDRFYVSSMEEAEQWRDHLQAYYGRYAAIEIAA